LSVFKVEQLRALALMFLELNTQANNICVVFFGFYCLLIGYLIFRSAFLPRILGVLMAFAGLGWLTFLSPPLANYLSPYWRRSSASWDAAFWLSVVFFNSLPGRLGRQPVLERI